MADNYLERKMEEYRSGKLSARVKSGVSRSLPKGKIAVDFPPRTVILAAGVSCRCQIFHRCRMPCGSRKCQP